MQWMTGESHGGNPSSTETEMVELKSTTVYLLEYMNIFPQDLCNFALTLYITLLCYEHNDVFVSIIG